MRRYNKLYGKMTHYDNRPYELLSPNGSWEQMHIEGLEPTARERLDTTTHRLNEIAVRIEVLQLAKYAMYGDFIRDTNTLALED